MFVRTIMAGILASCLAHPAAAQVYALATNPQGALTFNAGAAVAKLANDKLKLQLRVQPMAGSSTYAPLLNTGEVDFGFLNVEETLGAFHGQRSFAGKPGPNLRVLVALFPLPVAYIVPADSPIKSMKQLKGMRLASGFVGQQTLKVLQVVMLESVGFSMKDITEIPVVNTIQGIEALRDGKVDAAMTGVGVAQVQQAHVDLSSRGGVRYLPIETSPEALNVLRRIVPTRALEMQPAPHLPGIVGPTPVLSYSMYLLANQKVPDDVAYALVKMLHESRDELVKITPILTRFDPKAMTEKLDAPWHPGAIKFYTEIGQWPPPAG
jgi:TRAP transporter TAXI family solute receptor